jgi:peptide/nickel transport system permease protein
LRITRIQVLDELKKDYVMAAYARGLGEKKVVWQHAFRNALGPVLTSSAVSAATLVTSVYIVEKIFNLKGVSDLVTKFGPMVPDAAAVLGFAVYSTLIVLGLMFALDILQAIFLPQIKEETLENESV